MTAPVDTISTAAPITTAAASIPATPATKVGQRSWLFAAFIGVVVSVASSIGWAVVGMRDTRELGVIIGLGIGGYAAGHLRQASGVREWTGAVLAVVAAQFGVGLAIAVVGLILLGSPA